MDFISAVKSGFRHYVTFKGRAPRSEFWYWTLFGLLLTIAGGIADNALLDDPSPGLFGPLISLVLFLPGLAVSIRRLHDIDYSGWWWWIVFTVIGIIVLIAWACMKGTNGPNRYGPDPLGGDDV